MSQDRAIHFPETPANEDVGAPGTLKNVMFYLGTVLVFGAGILLVLRVGAGLAPETTVVLAQFDGGVFVQTLNAGLRHPLGVLLMQLIVVIGAARILGAWARRIGQPTVIGEIVAGILLGPSLLGFLLPWSQAFLFPATSLGALQLLSQIGVILFMFVVGVELDLRHLRRRAQQSILVSHASILVPFFLGVLLALLLYRQFAPPSVPFMAFALFMGIAMSITAFPVLARILQERALTQTPIGTVVIACAAVDDATAWCLLAAVVAIAKAESLGSAAITVALAVAFVLVMLLIVRPQAARRLTDAGGDAPYGAKTVAGVLIFVCVSALTAEVIGIHALFGAFLAGAVLPANGRLRTFLRERLETFSAVFLLPLFFAYTGLRTQISLIDDFSGWLLCAAVIAVAILGKVGGSMLAARWTGMNWKSAFTVGALMNTRGLVELIVLNIGYDLGILSPQLFTMMVIMALVTTLMTGPILALLGYRERRAQDAAIDGGEHPPVPSSAHGAYASTAVPLLRTRQETVDEHGR